MAALSEVEALDKHTKIVNGLFRPHGEVVRLAQWAMTWAKAVDDDPALRDRVVALVFTLFWVLRGSSTDDLLERVLGVAGMSHITQAMSRRACEGSIPEGSPPREEESRPAGG